MLPIYINLIKKYRFLMDLNHTLKHIVLNQISTLRLNKVYEYSVGQLAFELNLYFHMF